ncbi:MAG TPA: heme o synthase [Candidatus Polarisedimenticolia bacterium]|nr:heme o synthase [Candidatus Polarisedimenticolia bacterium]
MSELTQVREVGEPVERAAASWSDYLELTKPRVTSLVVATTAFGFYLGSRGAVDPLLLFHTLLGTTLVASGTSAYNMYLERDCDARMQRTRRRPLPDGRLRPVQALAFATLMSVAGILYLATAVNLLTSLLAIATLASYIFLYTPMKQWSALCTLVGAIPGALPPLGGWAAATGDLSAGGWSLFAILFLWQLPHSLAIAWMYRDDYERGGFRVLPVVDPEGGSTVRQIVANALALIPVSLTPVLLGVAGIWYFYGALLLGVAQAVICLRLAKTRSRVHARGVLLASVVYLPVLLFLMALNRT